MNIDTLHSYKIDPYKVRCAFGKAANTYKENAVLQGEVNRRLLERLDYIRINPIWILDVGAGNGAATRPLLTRYRQARVYALDSAFEMLSELRRQTKWLPARRLNRVCAEAACLPFAENSFDLIFSSLTFQWCFALTQVFTEIMRVLKPGGVLLFATLGPDTLQELRHSWSEVDDFEHVNRFVDMHAIGDMMLKAGYGDPVTDIDRIILNYPDIFSLLRSLKAIGANTVAGMRARGLTGKGRFQQMRQHYEVFRSGDGLPATYEIIYGHGWKPTVLSKSQRDQEVHISLEHLKKTLR